MSRLAGFAASSRAPLPLMRPVVMKRDDDYSRNKRRDVPAAVARGPALRAQSIFLIGASMTLMGFTTTATDFSFARPVAFAIAFISSSPVRNRPVPPAGSCPVLCVLTRSSHCASPVESRPRSSLARCHDLHAKDSQHPPHAAVGSHRRLL